MTSVGEKLKQFYFRLEDKWYDFLDALDRKKIPVYKVVDVLESKNIPSFPVAIIVLILILSSLFLFVLPGLGFGMSTLSLTVLDEDGNPLNNVSLSVVAEGRPPIILTTDAEGKAETTVPLGIEVTVIPVKAGFESIERTFLVNTPRFERDLVLSLEIHALTKRIQFKNLDGRTLSTEEVTVSFSCSENRYTRTDRVVRGEILLDDIPLDCGNLYITTQKFTSTSDYIDLDEAGTAEIFLAPLDVDTGKIIVVAKDNAGNPVPGLVAKLYTSHDSLYDTSFTGASGAATFEEVPVDSYYIAVTDETGMYEPYVGIDVVMQLKKDGISTFNALMKKGVVGKIRLKVLDRTSGLPVASAQVIISKRISGSDKDIALPVFTDAEGKAEIAVADAMVYRARIDHPEYLIAEKDGLTKTAEGMLTSVYLEPATAANSRTLAVTIVDERGLPIAGARGKLLTAAERNVIGTEKTTGASGKISFERLDAGKYVVHVYKPGYGEVLSDVVEVIPRIENKLSVTLPIGQGTLEIEVVDEEGNPVSGAAISVYDFAEKVQVGAQELTGADGRKSINLRADLQAYLAIEAAGFVNYTTAPTQMAKETTQDIKIMLVEDVPKLELAFLGLTVNDDEARDYLNPGQKYLAKFQLRVPEGTELDEIGAHIRTSASVLDQENIMENDGFYIKDIRAAADKISRGTSYTPPKGYGNDLTHLTNGAAKWAEAKWSKPGSGVFEIEVELQVKNVSQGMQLELNYRGWGKIGTYIRNPVDNELGNKEATASKQALYANAKTVFYSVGPSNLCMEGFCTILSIEDLSQNIETAIIDEFSAKIGNDYKLYFTISNAGAQSFDGVKLKVYNDTQAFNFYNYTAVVKGATKSGVVSGQEMLVDVGSFSPNEVVFGELSFKTVKDGAAKLFIELVGGKASLFRKEVIVNVAPAKDLTLDLIPKTIIPYLDNQVLARVLDAETESPIAGALVKIYANGELRATAPTNSSGELELELKAPAIGTNLKFEVEKKGYNTLTKTVKVSENLLEISPPTFKEFLVTTGIDSKENGIVANNFTFLPLTIASITVSGDDKRLLDFKFAEDYVGKIFEPGADLNFIFTVELTEKGKSVDSPETVKGTLDFKLSNEEFSEWTVHYPFEIRVGFGDQLDSPDCLLITPLAWKISTATESKSIDLRVKNNCAVDGKPVELRNFEVKVDHGNKNELGTFELESELAENIIPLKKNFQGIAEMLPANTDSTITLTFNPKQIDSGKGKPKVIFKAVNKTSHGDEVVELRMKTDLQINDLEKCIVLSGTQNLLVESCPMNTGWGNYRSYNPSTSYTNQREWMVRQGQSSNVPYGTPGYPSSPYPSTRDMEMYRMRQPSQYYSDPYFDRYNQSPASAQGWGCGQASFRIENACNAAVEIGLDAHPFLNVANSKLSLAPGQDATVKVGESIRVGNYPIDIRARVKDSGEPSKRVNTVTVSIISPTEINANMIVLENPRDGKFRFNNTAGITPVKGRIANYGYDMGLRLTRNSITKDSFVGGTTMVTDVITFEPVVKRGSDGKNVQYLDFELEKDLSYKMKEPFPETEEPVPWILDMRAKLREGYRTVEERKDLVIRYIDAYSQPRERIQPIIFEDVWSALQFAQIHQKGNPKAKPQDLIEPIDLGILDEDSFQGKDTYVVTKNVLKVGPQFAGDADKLSSPIIPNTELAKYARLGVKIKVEVVDNGKRFKFTITRTKDLKSEVAVKTSIKATLTRISPPAFSAVTVPLSFVVMKPGERKDLSSAGSALFDKVKDDDRERARQAIEASGLPAAEIGRLLTKLDTYKQALADRLTCKFYGEGYTTDPPKVKTFFDWSWKMIYNSAEKEAKSCSNADDIIFCDATQYSIELAKKEYVVRTVVNNALEMLEFERFKPAEMETKKKDLKELDWAKSVISDFSKALRGFFGREPERLAEPSKDKEKNCPAYECFTYANSLDLYKITKQQIRVGERAFFLKKNNALLQAEKAQLSPKDLAALTKSDKLTIETFKDPKTSLADLVKPEEKKLLALKNLVGSLDKGAAMKTLLVTVDIKGLSDEEKKWTRELLGAFEPMANHTTVFDYYVITFDKFADLINYLYACGEYLNTHRGEDQSKCPAKEITVAGTEYDPRISGGKTIDVAFLNKVIPKMNFVLAVENKPKIDEKTALYVMEKAGDAVNLVGPEGGMNYIDFYKNYVSFNSYLMADNFSGNFKKNFAGTFRIHPETENFTKHIFTIDKTADKGMISKPGEYKAQINYDWANEKTAFLLDYVSTTVASVDAEKNIFYYLPFNAGLEETVGRDYGIGTETPTTLGLTKLAEGAYKSQSGSEGLGRLAVTERTDFDEVSSGIVMLLWEGAHPAPEPERPIQCETEGHQCVSASQCRRTHATTTLNYIFGTGDRVQGCKEKYGRKDAVCCEKGYVMHTSDIKCEQENDVCYESTKFGCTEKKDVKGCNVLGDDFKCCDRGYVTVVTTAGAVKARNCPGEDNKGILYEQEHGVVVSTTVDGQGISWRCVNGAWTPTSASDQTTWNSIVEARETAAEDLYTVWVQPNYPTPVGLVIDSPGSRTGISISYNAWLEEKQIRFGRSSFLHWNVANSTMRTPAGKLAEFTGKPVSPLLGQNDLDLTACNSRGVSWPGITNRGRMLLKAIAYVPLEYYHTTMKFNSDPECTNTKASLITYDLIEKNYEAISFDPARWRSYIDLSPLPDVLGVQDWKREIDLKALSDVLALATNQIEDKQNMLCTKITKDRAIFKWNPEMVYSEEFEKAIAEEFG